MKKELIQEFSMRITQASRSELIVIMYVKMLVIMNMFTILIMFIIVILNLLIKLII